MGRIRFRRLNAPYTVTVTPATPTITHPTTQQMTVAVVNIHGTTLTGAVASGEWTSTNTAVATVDSAGLVTTVGGGATNATRTLTGSANFANTETVTIGSKVYTFQDTLTNVDGNVKVGADLQASLANLKAAINLEAGAGTTYAAAMTLHPTVTAASVTATTLVAQAKTGGPAGNAIATTDTGANANWGGATLAGGQGTCQIVFTSSNHIVDLTPAALTVN